MRHLSHSSGFLEKLDQFLFPPHPFLPFHTHPFTLQSLHPPSPFPLSPLSLPVSLGGASHRLPAVRGASSSPLSLCRQTGFLDLPAGYTLALMCRGDARPGKLLWGQLSSAGTFPGFVSWLPSILFVSWVVYEQGPLSSYLKLLKGFRRLLNFTYKGSLLLRYFHIYNANWAGWQLLEMKHPVLSSVVPFVGLCFHFSFLWFFNTVENQKFHDHCLF